MNNLLNLTLMLGVMTVYINCLIDSASTMNLLQDSCIYVAQFKKTLVLCNVKLFRYFHLSRQ